MTEGSNQRAHLSNEFLQSVRQLTQNEQKPAITLQQFIDSSADAYIRDSYGFISQQNAYYASCIANTLVSPETQFLGYTELAQISQNGIAKTICSTLSNDMLSAGYVISGVENEQDLQKIYSEAHKLNLNRVLYDALYDTFLYGGCLVYPQFKDVDYNNPKDIEELRRPLEYIPEKIGKGSLRGFKVISPQWVSPTNYETNNPLSDWFFEPSAYYINSQLVHCSRFIKFIEQKAPDILRPMYRFFGIPLLQQAIPYLLDFEQIRKEIIKIIKRLTYVVLTTDVTTLNNEGCLSSQDALTINSRLAVFKEFGANFDIFTAFTGEDVKQVSLPLDNLPQLFSQFEELLCIIPKMPATKLLGISPQGFNSTGEFEMRNYAAANIERQQSILYDNLFKFYNLLQLNLFGEIRYPNIDFTFNSLYTLSDQERAQERLSTAQALDILHPLINSDPEAIRNALKSTDDPLLNSLAEFQDNNEDDSLAPALNPFDFSEDDNGGF